MLFMSLTVPRIVGRVEAVFRALTVFLLID